MSIEGSIIHFAVARIKRFRVIGVSILRASEAGKICPSQTSLGAAAHPDGARLEVRGSRLRAKSTFSWLGLQDGITETEKGILHRSVNSGLPQSYFPNACGKIN